MPACQLQHVPYRLPVHARAFHRHVSDLALLQPLCQLLQILGERPELRGLECLFAAADAGPHTHRHRFLVYVKSSATTMYDTHVASICRERRTLGRIWTFLLVLSALLGGGDNLLCPTHTRSTRMCCE